MAVSYLEYKLQNGYVHNWLVAGPQAVPISDVERLAQKREQQIADHDDQADPGITQPPVERGSFTVGKEAQVATTDRNGDPGPLELTWRYVRCLDDHFVDLADQSMRSAFYHTWQTLRAWAYAQIRAPASLEGTFVLTTNGPADLWLNGQHVHHGGDFGFQDTHRSSDFSRFQDAHSVSFQATLRQGDNEILIRFEEVVVQECPFAMALQIAGLPADETAVRIPTTTERIERRQMFERIFEHAYVEQNVAYKGNKVIVRWTEDVDTRCNVALRVQDTRERTYVEAWSEAQPSASHDVGHPARLWEGPYFVALYPPLEEYYKHNVRYVRRIPIHVLDTPYAETPYGTYAGRRQEALEYAAKRGDNIFAEIAKMELGQWPQVDMDRIKETINQIAQRGDSSDLDPRCLHRSDTYRNDACIAVGMLGAMVRYMPDPAFLEALKGPLQACALGFRYWPDEPGNDAMCDTADKKRPTESADQSIRSILFHTCEILAGQLYPNHTFANAGQNGEWHRQRGERLALSWLHQRGTGGFQEWDSNCDFEEHLLALSHLADLAQNTEVRELAAVLMDKIFFTMAVNSFKGAFGSTHGRTYAPMIKSAQLEATSGLSRLMWGTGVWNHHIRGLVSLACSEYELPSIIADIALDQPQEMWNRERHSDLRFRQASGVPGPEVNKVTYKTPDYMLCSAQDYHAGEKGYQQHIWQATLGPDAVVFVNHPSCASESDARGPNFWCGNAVLPRVAQWKDVLIAVHRLPEDDWMGFTHAYFPIPSFDEHAIREDAQGHPWAFARQGSGYLAITAAQGLTLIRQGPGACRELRSYGPHNVWLCHMGRAVQDGSFEDFQRKVLALDVDWQGLRVRCTTLRGDTLSFGWEEPLTVGDREQPIGGFKHYENPYCVAELPASQMEIRFGDYLLRLHFAV